MPKRLGRYEIVRELGKGAMGIVYEGRDPNINRRVAIKTARRDVMDASINADEMMERFLREARAAGGLSHPNIITIYDADEEDGIAYIAMEYLEGGDLRDLIEQRYKIAPQEAVEMGSKICDALACAHEHGIVHRDIKPANILLPSNAPLKVADFGIAHVQDSTLTQDGALIGTPFYMSPEQFMGQQVDGRSDLFSVAIILYELLSGEKPFTGEAISTVMQHVIRTEPVPLDELNFLVPRPLSQVIMKALAKRPDERYQDGHALAAALHESMKSKPDSAILAVAPSDELEKAAGTPKSTAATVITADSAASPEETTQTPGTAAATTPHGDAPTMAAQRTAYDTQANARRMGEATVPGGAPPGAETTARPIPTVRGKLTPIFAGSAAVAFIVVAAVIAGALFGEKTPPANGGTPNEPAAPLPDKWIDTIAVQVYTTADATSLLNYNYKKSELPEDSTRVPGHLTIKDEDDNVIAEKDFDEGGAFIDLPGHPEKITMSWYGKLEDGTHTPSATSTWYPGKSEEKIGMEDTALLTLRP